MALAAAKKREAGSEKGAATLETTLASIASKFGVEAVIRMDATPKLDIEAVSTGSLQVDLALGIGGLPRGRIVEIYGPESSGKTTVALHCAASIQQEGGYVVFIDMEHALDPEYAKALGVDAHRLLVAQPSNAEEALEIASAFAKDGTVDMIVLDSVAALVPRAEIEGEMGDSHVGKAARLMSQALRKITPDLSRTNTTMIFINQLREKIGVMFGSPETTTGGKALKYYASVRLDVRRIKTEKDGDTATGNRTRVKVVKNKVAPPATQAEFLIEYGKGISRTDGVTDPSIELGFISKSGNTYSIDGEAVAVGRPKLFAYLDANPEKVLYLETLIREHYGVSQVKAPLVAADGQIVAETPTKVTKTRTKKADQVVEDETPEPEPVTPAPAIEETAPAPETFSAPAPAAVTPERETDAEDSWDN